MISEAKRRALADALRRGPVRFKNGAVVEWDPDWPSDLLIHCNGDVRRVNVHAHDQIAQAYETALAGPPPDPPPVAKVKPTRSRTDFGPCPF